MLAECPEHIDSVSRVIFHQIQSLVLSVQCERAIGKLSFFCIPSAYYVATDSNPVTDPANMAHGRPLGALTALKLGDTGRVTLLPAEDEIVSSGQVRSWDRPLALGWSIRFASSMLLSLAI